MLSDFFVINIHINNIDNANYKSNEYEVSNRCLFFLVNSENVKRNTTSYQQASIVLLLIE